MAEMNNLPQPHPVDKYRRYWQEHNRRQQVQRSALAAEARSQAAQIADLLVEQFNATQVVLFGSLVRQRFTEVSDIDLAVAGIEPGRFFEALAAVNQVTNRWVDLKPLEDLEPHFYQRVMATGEVMYDQSHP